MRVAVLLATMLLAARAGGCSYDEPDLSDTLFKCDDGHGCPSGFACLAGACQVLSPTSDGVKCSATLTCAPGQQCCIDGTNPPRCLSPFELCVSLPGASCDGVEDCPTGARCCAIVGTACDPSCSTIACTDIGDCPSDKPNCCMDTDMPWGRCRFQCT